MREPSVLHFIKVGRGRIGLHHRPRGADFPILKELGCTHVVTLLKDSEGAAHIGRMSANAGLDWIWLPVPNGNRPQGEVHERLFEALPRLSQLLDQGASLLIHCSAGIHRTGTVTYGLLRWRGLSREQALKLIAQMRPITAAEVGEKRLVWGNEVARPLSPKETSWIHFIKESAAQFWMNLFKKR
ncbi:MAG: protein-tyrosine phosphatase family protein [Chloroflexota bacterium]